MIAVQAAGCRPVVDAFERGQDRVEFFENAATVASGLRVPKPFGDSLILQAVRASDGTAIAVEDSEILEAGLELARQDGIFAAPEGAACLAGLKKLLQSGFLSEHQTIVLYNTGSGLKYLDSYRPLLTSGGATLQ
jgi:threonine synthase